ncbi:MAG: hypothetical protein NVS4B12_27610 [Ktedonobacteraceae bacterium]
MPGITSIECSRTNFCRWKLASTAPHNFMTEDNVGDNSEQSTSSKQPIHTNVNQADDVVTVVLTADNHLGYTAFGQQPRKREELQQRLRRAFQQATEFAVGQGVDLFVQAGDLFDTPVPDERDRSFVAARLAQLRQAGIRTFAVGGVHDTPAEMQTVLDGDVPTPQMSYARLGALHYFAPSSVELDPVIFKVRNVLVGICGLGVLAGQAGNPLMRMRVQSDIERAAIPLLLLHAPIEGLTSGSSLLNTRVEVSRASIENQPFFRYILAGYHHSYHQLHIGQSEVIVASATQHIDFSSPEQKPGFVFLGLAADGIRWCTHIPVDALLLQRLDIQTKDLWLHDIETEDLKPTETILEQLRPLCSENTMVQLRLAGKLTRHQYHQLDLNRIRRYGEEQCFALAIDDSALKILPTRSSDVSFSNEESVSVGDDLRRVERLSPREELVALADEWITAVSDEQEKKALYTTKEDLLAALDEVKSRK